MSIIKGFANLIFREEKELAKERKSICKNCPVSEFGKSRFCKLRNGGCGCLISAKVSDPEEECPKKKWLKMERIKSK